MEQKNDIQTIIRERRSLRAMNGGQLSSAELEALFEAARWAPSSYNAQPWRFIYGKKDTPHWSKLFDLLIERNQAWVQHGSVLILVLSRKFFEHNNKPSATHSFDTGAAWENLALEGTSRGLVVHGMQGFNYVKAKEVFAIPDLYQIEMMIVIGKQGSKEVLSAELQIAEGKRERKPLKDIIQEGFFGFS